MDEEKPQGTREGQSEQFSSEAINAKAFVEALNLPDLAAGLKRLGEMVRCLVEGSPEPIERVQPPDGFRVRAWQEIPGGDELGTLQLRIEGQSRGRWNVEVAYEDFDQKVEPQRLKEGKVDFELPASWLERPGPRFVTVYLRKAGSGAGAEQETKKGEEEADTIIRIIPAPVRAGYAQDFDEIEAAEGTDD